MQTTLHWRKNWLDSSCAIFSADRAVGKLNESFWSPSAEGALNEKRYSFDTKGFFRQETSIIDHEEGTTLENISYNYWKNSSYAALAAAMIIPVPA